MNRIVKVISLLVIMTLLSVWVFGQAESGAINGIVTDKTGAVVVGATVTATSVDTGLVRTATTGSAGEYAITNLPPRLYNVTVEAKGFQKYAQKIKVDVGSINEISTKLAVTGVSTTVEVTGSAATAAVVNTETQTLSQTISSQQMVDLPTLTRNPYDLVATAGNVTEDNNGARGAGYSINGTRSSNTDILLDGGENVDLFTATVGQSVPLDTVQEFSILTNNFTAEYGRTGGGVVNVATKSGTNNFHGSLYEFNRLSALAANTYNNDANGIQKPGFTRNQFGYSIGGPIVKNKLFFFSGTEWTRVRSNSVITQSILDPAFVALPQVDAATKAFFTAFGHLRSNLGVLQNVNWQQANGGSCPTPLPCNAPFGQFVQYTVPSDSGGGFPQNTYSTVNRVDWNISDKNTLYVRYALYSEDDFPGTVNASPYVGYDTGQTVFNQNITINFTHVFTPNLVSSSKVIYNRLNTLSPLGSNPVSPTLYTSTAVPALPGTNGSLVFPGYSETTPGIAIPVGGPQNLYQFYEDLNWTKGKHQFKFGGEYIHTRDNRVFGAFENAVETLSASGSISEAAANLVAGQLFQFQGASFPQGKFPCFKDASGKTIVTPECTLNLPVGPPAFGRNNRYNDGAWYAQDSWKVNPRLTLNFGLRWEYYGVQHNTNPSLDSNFYLGVGANIYEQVRNGTVQIANQSPVGGLWAKDLNNLAPRVGFAWDIFGDGTTSLRGGYGMGYERNYGNVTFNVIQNPPNYAVISLVAGSDVPVLPIFTNNSGPLAGTGTKPLPGTSLRAVKQDLPTAYTQFWSASIDRQVTRNSVLSIEYSGSKGTGLYDIANLNDAGYGSAFLGDARAANRLNYQYTNINYRSGSGFSNYNGVNLKFSSNNLFNKGLQLVANYTWSHSIDNLSDTFSGGYSSNYGLGYLNAFNPSLDKGNSDYDTRHRFVVSAVWDLPWMKNASNAFARQALEGWSMSPVVKVHSGYPFSIYDCTNLTGSSGFTCPRYVPGASVAQSGHADVNNPIPGSPNLFTYLPLPLDANGVPVGNGNAFAVPVCSGLFGVGCVYTQNGQGVPRRNSFQSPGFWNIDFVAMKNFKLTERFTMQFRGEFYNIFNHHNMYIQATNLDIENGTGVTAINAINGTPSAGSLNSALPDERRNIQFAIKVLF